MSLPDTWKIALFSKHVQQLSLETLAQQLPQTGISALDLTVRPGGHVEPADAAEKLPALCEFLRQRGIAITMISTNITDAADPVTLQILKAAAACGIPYYKTGYFSYDGFGTLARRKAEVREKFQRLAELNATLGIHGAYHNHSDLFFGATVGDIVEAQRDIPKAHLGIYFDVTHATIEGGGAAWEQSMDAAADRISMIAIKDFIRLDNKSGYTGSRRSSVLFHPLLGGEVCWPKFMQNLNKMAFSGPVSFHSEYQGPHSFADLCPLGVLHQTQIDFGVFKGYYEASMTNSSACTVSS